jgi:hypothetical protein
MLRDRPRNFRDAPLRDCKRTSEVSQAMLELLVDPYPQEVMSVYLGVAEAARDLAMQQVQRKRVDSDTWCLLGELNNALVTAWWCIPYGAPHAS